MKSYEDEKQLEQRAHQGTTIATEVNNMEDDTRGERQGPRKASWLICVRLAPHTCMLIVMKACRSCSADM
jgi:hypothetical protein